MSSDLAGQFELHKAQVAGSLSTLANNLRECASYADQFAQVIHALPWGGQPGAFPIPNGQYPISMMPPMPMVHDDHGKKRKSRDDDGRRKQKKPRDPNAPKRPPSSYLLFQNDIRAELKAKHPEMRNNELLGAIAKLWGSMPQEQKDVYEARNKLAKDTWMAQKKVYEAGKPGAPDEPVSISAMSTVVPAVVKEVAAAAAASSTSGDEDSVAEDEDDSSHNTDEEEDEDDEDEDEDSAPPPKKTKKSSNSPSKAEGHSKKEKKHKKEKV